MRISGLLAVISLAIGCGQTCAAAGAPPGFLEGHLKIVALQPVQLAEAEDTKSGPLNYARYPLVVLRAVDRQQVARITVEQTGTYRVALPPGEYVLDVERRAPGHLRATPKTFSVISGRTVHADFQLDTGVR